MAFPIWAAIGGGLKLLSSFGGMFGNHSSNGISIEDAVISNALQKDLFDYQFNKQLQAMNSAHQREVTDLRKAGLNPILSATGGSGLNSPTGSMPDISSINSALASSRQADRQMKVNAFLGVVDRALQAQANGIANKNAVINEINADTQKLNAMANLRNAETKAIGTAADVEQKLFQNENITWQNKKIASDIGLNTALIATNSAHQAKLHNDIYIANEMLPYEKFAKKAVPVWNLGSSEVYDLLDQFKTRFNSANDFFQNLGKQSGHYVGKGIRSWWNAWNK